MTKLDQRQAQFVDTHSSELYDILPEPNKEWQWSEISDKFSHGINSLTHYNLIEKVSDAADGPATWSTKRAVYDRVEESAGNSNYPLPCHSGIKNVGGDRPYTCRNEQCDKRYTREDVSWTSEENEQTSTSPVQKPKA